MDTPIFSFGGIKSPYDYRDVPFAAVAAGIPEVVPDTYFPSFFRKLPVWNQRKIGACVGHAWGKTRQKSEFQEKGQIIPLSARFLYALAKSIDGLPGDVGTYPRVVAKILKDKGICTEGTLANDTTLTFDQYVDVSQIPQSAYDEAKQYAIGGYGFANINADEIKKAIWYAGEQRKDIVMLVRVGKEWWTDRNGNVSWNATDLLPIRPPQTVVSGHEIYPLAYETVNGRLKIWFINSWTENWADQGMGWFYFDEYQKFIDEVMTAVDLPDNWQEQINNLPPANQFKHNFVSDIVFGEQDDEVKALQTALMIDGEFNKDLYAKLLGQNQLGYYGEITRQAVLNFQLKYKVASLGELFILRGRKVGPKTRLALNNLFNK